MIYVLLYVVYLDFTTKQKVNLAQARAGSSYLYQSTVTRLNASQVSVVGSVAWHKKAYM